DQEKVCLFSLAYIQDLLQRIPQFPRTLFAVSSPCVRLGPKMHVCDMDKFHTTSFGVKTLPDERGRDSSLSRPLLSLLLYLLTPALVLQLTVIHCSRERNHVADVGHSCQIHHAALKTESESCMSR